VSLERESAGDRGRILLVEDSPINIQALAAVLREAGYHLHVATTGVQALDALTRVRPDLILLDVMMPEIDGYETCRRIKASREWRDIPIIFLTSRTATDDIVRGFELGAVDYVSKPVHAQELLARVGTHLAVDRLRRENERLIREESELARHRSVAQMVAGVAHELNTPLGVVNTAANLIAQRLSAPALSGVAASSPAGQELVDDLAAACRLIERNITRAHKLVQDFKKVSVNQIADIRDCVILAEVIEETAHLFRVTARESRMDVVIVNALPDAGAEWTGYPGLLSQVLLNLLSNAQLYAYPGATGGRVEILIGLDPERAEERFQIAVRDTGAGIAPEHLPRIFDPFFTTGRGQGGSGLGMAIVHSIVTAQLQGSIIIESTVGHGTTVSLSIPRTVPASTGSRQSP